MKKKAKKKVNKKQKLATLTIRLDASETKSIKELCRQFNNNTNSGMIKEMIANYAALDKQCQEQADEIFLIKGEHQNLKWMVEAYFNNIEKLQNAIK